MTQLTPYSITSHIVPSLLSGCHQDPPSIRPIDGPVCVHRWHNMLLRTFGEYTGCTSRALRQARLFCGVRSLAISVARSRGHMPALAIAIVSNWLTMVDMQAHYAG